MPGLGGAWRSLVAHLLWEQGVGGSNPLAPTAKLARPLREPCGCSSTVEPQPSKLVMGVRFPSPALDNIFSPPREPRPPRPLEGCRHRPVRHIGVSPQGLLVTVPPSDFGERRGAGSEQDVDVPLSDRLKTASMKGSVTGSLSSRPSHPSRGVTTVRRVSVASSP